MGDVASRAEIGMGPMRPRSGLSMVSAALASSQQTIRSGGMSAVQKAFRGP